MLSDKHYTPKQIEQLIEELQELMEEIIMYEYDYMSEEGKVAVERIADILNLNILE